MKKFILFLICVLWPINIYALTDEDCYSVAGLIFATNQCMGETYMVANDPLAQMNFSMGFLNECSKNHFNAFSKSEEFTKKLKNEYPCSTIFNLYKETAQRFGVFVGNFRIVEN